MPHCSRELQSANTRPHCRAGRVDVSVCLGVYAEAGRLQSSPSSRHFVPPNRTRFFPKKIKNRPPFFMQIRPPYLPSPRFEAPSGVHAAIGRRTQLLSFLVVVNGRQVRFSAVRERSCHGLVRTRRRLLSSSWTRRKPGEQTQRTAKPASSVVATRPVQPWFSS